MAYRSTDHEYRKFLSLLGNRDELLGFLIASNSCVGIDGVLPTL